MGLFDRLRRPGLSPANTPPDWVERGEWREWPPPRDLVADPRTDEIARLAGPQGGVVPVAAGLIRDRFNPADPDTIRVEVEGRLVGRLRRGAAAALAPALDRARCPIVTVCAVVRGGAAPAVYLWPERRLSDGPDIALPDD